MLNAPISVGLPGAGDGVALTVEGADGETLGLVAGDAVLLTGLIVGVGLLAVGVGVMDGAGDGVGVDVETMPRGILNLRRRGVGVGVAVGMTIVGIVISGTSIPHSA